jgi:hypothetical protein
MATPAPGPQAVVEAGQRTGGADGRVGRLAEEPPGVGLTGPADAPAERRPVAGLTDPGIEPEIADQLGRPFEPPDVAHHGEDRGGGHQADPRDGQETPDPLVVHHEGGDGPFGRGDLLAEQGADAQRSLEGEPLLGGQFEVGQPDSAANPEEVADGRPHQAAGEEGRCMKTEATRSSRDRDVLGYLQALSQGVVGNGAIG